MNFFKPNLDPALNARCTWVDLETVWTFGTGHLACTVR
jgi:hypothetical protein